MRNIISEVAQLSELPITKSGNDIVEDLFNCQTVALFCYLCVYIYIYTIIYIYTHTQYIYMYVFRFNQQHKVERKGFLELATNTIQRNS